MHNILCSPLRTLGTYFILMYKYMLKSERQTLFKAYNYALSIILKCSENTDHIYRDIIITHVWFLCHDKCGPCFLSTSKSYFKYDICYFSIDLCSGFRALLYFRYNMVPKVRKGLP